ncbi:MAG TPA: ABC transporter ATP-binding protein [Actinomycetota bacterium]|jgi:ABC-2 type transport system ATP-binding protein|nr:ABC transporter ATP-binding protein [Actinomycetota bacterium]
MTTGGPIVSLADVGKRYVKYDDVPTLVSGLVRRRWRNRRSVLWALRHVHLGVERGEAVGVIGRNGAGKSTMLAMLAGVTAPTEGVVTVRGRVAPLLRLGVGFHDELTGRENVYINATILGLTEREIDKEFDDIVDFAELAEFIDTPVKFYSSGMQARLGFSVAVASRPDVLLVDEILAVGDVSFQMRSFDRMIELQKNGATILVVSHNLDAIRRVCSRVLVLNQGTPYFEGDAGEAIGKFHDLLRVTWDQAAQGMEGGPTADADAPLEVLDIELLDEDGTPTASFETGARMSARVGVRFRRALTDPMAGLWVTNNANQLVYASSSFGTPTGHFDAGARAYFDVDIGLHVVTGTYTLGCWVGWRGADESSPDRIDHVRAPAKPFYVSGPTRRGVADLGARFSAHHTDDVPTTSNREAASDPLAP